MHVGDIQLDNCARWIRLFVVSLCRNSHFRPFCGAAKWTSGDFRAGEFSARHPVKFSAPAAGYHFHDLTGGKVNFTGIFSEGSGRKRGACVFFFRFVCCFGYFHCCSQRECSGVSPPLSTCAWARVISGCVESGRPESRGKLKKKLDTDRLLSSLLLFY